MYMHAPSTTPFSPSLISLMVSVDVKHQVYLSLFSATENVPITPLHPNPSCSLVCYGFIGRARYRPSAEQFRQSGCSYLDTAVFRVSEAAQPF